MNKEHFSLKNEIKTYKEELCIEFDQKANIVAITHKLALFIDKILIQLFTNNKMQQGHYFCLIALGSYGRRELQLHSDIDLLILHSEQTPETELQKAQTFIQDCWDVG